MLLSRMERFETLRTGNRQELLVRVGRGGGCYFGPGAVTLRRDPPPPPHRRHAAPGGVGRLRRVSHVSRVPLGRPGRCRRRCSIAGGGMRDGATSVPQGASRHVACMGIYKH